MRQEVIDLYVETAQDLEGGFMGGQEPPNRVYSAEHQQPTRGYVGIVPCKAESTRDLPIRQRAERAVRAATCVPHHLPEAFKFKRVKICPFGAADTQAGPVHCAPVDLVGEHFVSVISQAARLPVPSQCSSHVHTLRGTDHPETIRDFNDQDFLVTYLDASYCH
jgi:hypothetical protein